LFSSEEYDEVVSVVASAITVYKILILLNPNHVIK